MNLFVPLKKWNLFFILYKFVIIEKPFIFIITNHWKYLFKWWIRKRNIKIDASHYPNIQIVSFHDSCSDCYKGLLAEGLRKFFCDFKIIKQLIWIPNNNMFYCLDTLSISHYWLKKWILKNIKVFYEIYFHFIKNKD